MQFLGAGYGIEWWQFVLERAEESFHVAVLPWAGFGTGAERYFQPLAQFLVFVAQVFGALVRMQYGRHGVPAKGIQQCRVRQIAGVAQAQFPAEHLPRFEIQHDCQVVVLPVDPQVRKILYPGTTIHHATW